MKNRSALLAFLFCTSVLNYCDRSAIAAVLPLIRSDFHLSEAALGAVGTAFLWAFTAGAPVGGLLADRISRARLIVVCLFAWNLVTLATGFAASGAQLLGLRVLLGLAEASYVPAALALIADTHPPRTRGTAIGIHVAGQSIGAIVGGTGLGYLADHFGWRRGFLVLGCAGLVMAAAAWVFLGREGWNVSSSTRLADPGASNGSQVCLTRRGRRVPPFEKIISLLRIPAVSGVIAASMLNSVGTWTFLFWLPLYFRETYGLSFGRAGFAGTFWLQVAAVAGLVLGGVFSDRWGHGRPGRGLLVPAAAFAGAAPFLLVFLAPHPDPAALRACIFLFSFLLWFGSSAALALVCNLLPPDSRATAVSLVSGGGTLAGGLGVFVAGPLKDVFGLGGVFAGISGVILLSAVILFACYGARPPAPWPLESESAP